MTEAHPVGTCPECAIPEQTRATSNTVVQAEAHAQATVEEMQAQIAELQRKLTKAASNYQFMVERAAGEKLDGYRELGQRAAQVENERDELRRELAQARERNAELEAALRPITNAVAAGLKWALNGYCERAAQALNGGKS